MSEKDLVVIQYLNLLLKKFGSFLDEPDYLINVIGDYKKMFLKMANVESSFKIVTILSTEI